MSEAGEKTGSESVPYFHVLKIQKPMGCDGFSVELHYNFSISLENIYLLGYKTIPLKKFYLEKNNLLKSITN